MTVWVSEHNYRWARFRWEKHHVAIDNYISNEIIKITRPGFLFNPRCTRRVAICPVILKIEKEKWQEWYETPKALRKYLK